MGGNRRRLQGLAVPGASLSSGAAGAPVVEVFEDAALESAKAEAKKDSDLIEQFVRERCPSEHTAANYRASLRRLGWFCKFVELQSVRQLQRDQWAEYRAYLRDPPADHIMAHRSVSYGAPGWAPFRGPLSERSAKQSEIIAKVFYGWMADPAVGAIAHSPVATIRTHAVRRSATEAGVHRFLPGPVWPYIDQPRRCTSREVAPGPNGSLLWRFARACGRARFRMPGSEAFSPPPSILASTTST